MSRTINSLCWSVIAVVVTVVLVAAAKSPLLAWRDPIYILAGFAGVIAMALLIIQPMLISGYMPGLSIVRSRRVHRWIGSMLVFSVVVHVIGLWVTSPPDVIDALLFASPTPFSIWGVIAMWAVFSSACLALVRRKFGSQLNLWRVFHKILAAVIVLGSVLHAIQIEGTMEIVSKWLLCAVALVITSATIAGYKLHR